MTFPCIFTTGATGWGCKEVADGNDCQSHHATGYDCQVRSHIRADGIPGHVADEGKAGDGPAQIEPSHHAFTDCARNLARFGKHNLADQQAEAQDQRQLNRQGAGARHNCTWLGVVPILGYDEHGQKRSVQQAGRDPVWNQATSIF